MPDDRTDAELIGVMLGGRARRAAAELLERFGGLRPLLDAEVHVVRSLDDPGGASRSQAVEAANHVDLGVE